MLGSIHPLGERSRNNRWGLTIGAYVVGSVAGGALAGTAVGAVGFFAAEHLRAAPAIAGWMAVAACLTACLVDAAAPQLVSVASVKRQVDEDWLGRYRGWVYGVGFGFQLGAGVMTIVVSAAVYLVFTLAFLTGSPWAGALIGGTFVLARAGPVLGLRRAGAPQQLWALHRRHAGQARRVSVMVIVAELLLAVVAAYVAAGA
jgi:hypothetical protein